VDREKKADTISKGGVLGLGHEKGGRGRGKEKEKGKGEGHREEVSPRANGRVPGKRKGGDMGTERGGPQPT